MIRCLKRQIVFTAIVVLATLALSVSSRGDDGLAANFAPPSTVPSAPQADGSQDLRSLIGINPAGLKHVEVPQVPAMGLRGYVQPHGQPAMALLELTDLKRIFLVQQGTEIPVTVQGTVTPTGHGELSGLSNLNTPNENAPQEPAQATQSQIILKVLSISDEGVTVEEGLDRQTIIIR